MNTDISNDDEDKNTDLIKHVIIKQGNQSSDMYFNKFDLKSLNKNSGIAIIGKRGCGKSFVACSIAKSLFLSNNDNKIDDCVVICPTEKINNIYSTKLEFANVNVFDNYDSSIIQNIMFRQKELEKKDIFKNVLLILDDCFSLTSELMDETIRNLFFNYRLYRITFIFTMPYPFKFTPEMRCQLDYIFIASEAYIKNQQMIYNNYAGMFPTFDLFKQTVDQLTENYSMMVINNKNINGIDLMDIVKWFTGVTS